MKLDALETIKEKYSIEVSLNAIQADALFKFYKDAGFLYPDKLTQLIPYADVISDNWNTLINNKEGLLLVLTATQNNTEKFASITLWKNGTNSIFSQHLVSNGNPRLSLLLILESMRAIQWDTDHSSYKSTQNWFRLNNRYARRVFATSHKILGKAHSSLIRFQYLTLPLTQIQKNTSNLFKIEEISEPSHTLNDFISKQLNPVFISAEELNNNDIQLSELKEKYESCHLQRRRSVLKISDSETNEIIGCIIANRAPLGLNFSFLENRTYYIVDRNLDKMKLEIMVREINCLLQPFYQGIECQSIPIVTDKKTAETLLDNGANFIREYTQVIWLKEARFELQNYFYSLLDGINKYGKGNDSPAPSALQ